MATEGQWIAGRYRLEAPIGRGGHATVYRALDERTRRRVAVKALHQPFDRDPAFVGRLRREAQTVAQLSHPNVVQVYDWVEEGDGAYLIMEYVAGTDLRQELNARGRLPVAEAVALAVQVAEGLGAAHARGLVHRDVKPQNVLLETAEDGGDRQRRRAKVADFGVARALAAGATTTAGLAIGTVQYMPPEQAQGRPVGPSADVYALGVLLFEMLTGELPFSGDSPVAIALQHIQAPPPRLAERGTAAPAWLETALARALAKDPSQRFADGRAFAAALQTGLAGAAAETMAMAPVTVAREAPVTPAAPAPTVETGRSAQPVRPPEPPRPVRPATRRRPWLPVALLVVLLGLTGGWLGAWLLPRLGPEVGAPRVIGLVLADAKREAERFGLSLSVIGQRLDALLPPQTVVDQQPLPGEPVRPGADLRVVLSQRPAQARVPNLVRMTPAIAEAELKREGLVLGQQKLRESTTEQPGRIVEQQPPPEARVAPGTPVDVVVTAAPATTPTATASATPIPQPPTPSATPSPSPTLPPTPTPPPSPTSPPSPTPTLRPPTAVPATATAPPATSTPPPATQTPVVPTATPAPATSTPLPPTNTPAAPSPTTAPPTATRTPSTPSPTPPAAASPSPAASPTPPGPSPSPTGG